MLVALLLLVCTLAGGPPAGAAEPSSGSLSATDGYIFWDVEAPPTLNALDGYDCRNKVPLAATCDTFTLTTVDAGTVSITAMSYSECEELLSLTSPHLWIYDASGNLVAESTLYEEGCGGTELASFTAVAGGVYRIRSGHPIFTNYFYATAYLTPTA